MEQLWNAAFSGKLARCRQLLDRGVVQRPNRSGATPLYAAAQKGHVALCQLLLDRAATHQADREGATPLMIAAQHGHVKVCELLLDRGATHAAKADGWTPLHGAVWGGHVDVCGVLLARGATQAPTCGGETPLYIAADKGCREVCTLLLDHGATHAAGDFGTSPLFIAAQNGHRDVCALLLDRGATHAASHGSEPRGQTPLHVAAEKGHLSVCKLLLERAATHAPADDGSTPLFIAASNGHIDVCALLLDCGATHAGDRGGRTPLSAAASHGHAEVCSLLLRRGATHAADESGATPLYAASFKGHINVCAVLLDHGATHVANSNGATPLIAAAQTGNAPLLSLLAARGANAAADAATCAARGWAVGRLLEEFAATASSSGTSKRARGETQGAQEDVPARRCRRVHRDSAAAVADSRGRLPAPPDQPPRLGAHDRLRASELSSAVAELQLRVSQLGALPLSPDATAAATALRELCGALQHQVVSIQQHQQHAAWHLELRPADFALEEEDVHRGAFGTVSRGTYQGQAVALKRLKAPKGGADESALAQLRQEVDALEAVKHAHVLRLLAVCTRHEAVDVRGRRIGLGIVFPWMERSLKDHITAVPPPAWVMRMSWLREVALGLAALHSAGLVHRDLKAANVMIDAHGHALVADLGLAGAFGADITEAGTAGGTTPWMAPELFEGSAATPASDVYAFGMLLFEVAMREQPWADAAQHDVPLLVSAGDRPILRASTRPLEAYEVLYERCCRQDPSHRPSVLEIADALAVMRATVAEVNTASTAAKARRAPWHVPDSLRAELLDAAAVASRTTLLPARRGERGFDSLLRHVLQNIAPHCSSRTAGLLPRREIIALTLVCNMTRELAFFAVCEQLDRRYADIEAPDHPFHPTWRLPTFVRNGRWTLKQTPAQVAWRRKVADHVSATLPNWAGGLLRHARVIVAFHACTDAAVALRILDTGFAPLSVQDPGFFGQGLYFTPDLDYAADVYGSGTHATVLACALVFGNPYPVTEHPHQSKARGDTLLGGRPPLLGAANVPRYDAHVAVVQRHGRKVYYPYPPETWDDPVFLETRGRPFTEIVVFERAHVLPLAVLTIERSN